MKHRRLLPSLLLSVSALTCLAVAGCVLMPAGDRGAGPTTQPAVDARALAERAYAAVDFALSEVQRLESDVTSARAELVAAEADGLLDQVDAARAFLAARERELATARVYARLAMNLARVFAPPTTRPAATTSPAALSN